VKKKSFQEQLWAAAVSSRKAARRAAFLGEKPPDPLGAMLFDQERLQQDVATLRESVAQQDGLLKVGRNGALAEKLKDPKGHPFMTVEEARAKLHVSRSTVYRWLEEGQLKRARTRKETGRKARCLIDTQSVVDLLEPSPEYETSADCPIMSHHF